MRPKAVLCGSYHRAPERLKRLFRELEATGCRVLSPITLAFDGSPFVRTAKEEDLSANALELFHLRAIRDSDFVLLHAPEGYVGISAAYELGYAAALRVPCFCFETPSDEMLASQLTRVTSVFEILERLQLMPF